MRLKNLLKLKLWQFKQVSTVGRSAKGHVHENRIFKLHPHMKNFLRAHKQTTLENGDEKATSNVWILHSTLKKDRAFTLTSN